MDNKEDDDVSMDDDDNGLSVLVDELRLEAQTLDLILLAWSTEVDEPPLGFFVRKRLLNRTMACLCCFSSSF